MIRPEIILWGFKPGHGGVLKLEPYTRAAYARRTKEGWTCGAYAKGDDPVGLRLLLAAKVGVA